MEALNLVAQYINDGYRYLVVNKVTIAAVVLGYFFLKSQSKKQIPCCKEFSDTLNYLHFSHFKPVTKVKNSSKSYSLTGERSSSNKDIDRSEEMRRARERQQEIASQRAKEAAVLRKEKEEQEKKRKNSSATLKAKNGEKLNSTSTSRSTPGYNPLQPWSASSTSYR